MEYLMPSPVEMRENQLGFPIDYYYSPIASTVNDIDQNTIALSSKTNLELLGSYMMAFRFGYMNYSKMIKHTILRDEWFEGG